MRYIVHCQNVVMSEALKTYLEQKIVCSLDLHYPDSTISPIIISLETRKKQHIIKVSILSKRGTIRATHLSDNMYKSIDLVSMKLKKQVIACKSKKLTKRNNRREKLLLHKQFLNDDLFIS